MKAYSPRARQAALMLRGAGLSYHRIGKLIGVTATTARRWVDPDAAERDRALARANKLRYRGTCMDCGAATSYSGKRGRVASLRCVACHKELERSESYRESLQLWTRARIVLAIREWAAIYGEPPAIPDWGPSSARSRGDEARAARFEAAHGKWPWFTIVVRRFGTWNAAIEAAGFSGRCNSGGCGNMMRRRDVRARLEREAA